jgi:hypothetical protein
VRQGISIRFGIAVVLQCTARYRRYLQAKLSVMCEHLVICFGIWDQNLDFMFFVGPF